MNLKDLSDDEIVEAINESFSEDGRITTDYLNVECLNGKPIISGRVPSDEELQVLDEIMKDVMEVETYESSVWVDDSLAFEADDEETQPVSFDDEENMEADESFEESEEDEE